MLQQQICQRCGNIFAERNIDGPEFVVSTTASNDHDRMCPKCGGTVRWSDGSLASDPVLTGGTAITKAFLCFLSAVILAGLGMHLGNFIQGPRTGAVFFASGFVAGAALSAWKLFRHKTKSSHRTKSIR